MGDNYPLMTRTIPLKKDIMDEICDELRIDRYDLFVGSSIPSEFFSRVARELGIPVVSGMPAMARRIVEHGREQWTPECSSELSESGGGGTVTAFGLLKMKEAIWKLKGKTTKSHGLKDGSLYEIWIPRSDWNQVKAELPSELREFTARPNASQFRARVLGAYGNICVISGSATLQAVEVAHVVPYFGIESDQVQNALPLRADLHKLFDVGLLRIEHNSANKRYQVRIHYSIFDDYGQYDQMVLKSPEDPSLSLSPFAIEVKNDLHKDKWQSI